MRNGNDHPNGHPKGHQCPVCIQARFDEFVDRLEAFEKHNGVRPASAEQTVMVKRYSVRAHFRRNPYHLQGDPGLRELVQGYLKNETKPAKARPRAKVAHAES